MSQAIEGKIVIVTDAGSGIGRALACGFSHDGASVIGFDTNSAGLQQTADSCEGRFVMVVGDVCEGVDVERLVEDTIEQFGRIDVLINNAGIANQGNLLDLDFADWQAVIDVNLIGLARCMWQVLPQMQKQGSGRIVNVCPREGGTGRRTLSAYSASKGGVAVLTKSIARELAKSSQDDIIVSGLIPGGTKTHMNTNEAMQSPDAVYPHTRYIVKQPKGSPNGRVYFKSADYPMFTLFNQDRAQVTSG